jgi:hypothetical protein
MYADHRLGLRRIGDVRVARAAIDLGGDTSRGSLVDVDDDDPRSFARQPPARRLADPRAAARDERHAPLEAAHARDRLGGHAASR